jgi:hypothetical protein
VQEQRFPVMSGESVVSADGALELGRYGRFQVTGRPVAQMSVVMEEHVKPFVINPRVKLALKGQGATTAPGSTPTSWTSQKVSTRNWESTTAEKKLSGWHTEKTTNAINETRPQCGWKNFDCQSGSDAHSGTRTNAASTVSANPPARTYGPIMSFFMGKR